MLLKTITGVSALVSCIIFACADWAIWTLPERTRPMSGTTVPSLKMTAPFLYLAGRKCKCRAMSRISAWEQPRKSAVLETKSRSIKTSFVVMTTYFCITL